MVFVFLLLVQATTASVPAPSPSIADGAAAPAGHPLWRDLRTGMTVEETATTLAKVDGVKTTKVKLRKKIPDSVDVDYTDGGILVGNQRFVVLPLFTDHALKGVTLATERCATPAVEQAKLLTASLVEKYPSNQIENVIDENNVRQERRAAFWNGDTRVRLSMTPIAPPERTYQNEYAGGFLGAMAKLANSLNKSAIEAAMSACPDDAGYKLRTTIVYSSQSEFLVEHKAETDERNAQAKARKDAL